MRQKSPEAGAKQSVGLGYRKLYVGSLAKDGPGNNICQKRCGNQTSDRDLPPMPERLCAFLDEIYGELRSHCLQPGAYRSAHQNLSFPVHVIMYSQDVLLNILAKHRQACP